MTKYCIYHNLKVSHCAIIFWNSSFKGRLTKLLEREIEKPNSLNVKFTIPYQSLFLEFLERYQNIFSNRNEEIKKLPVWVETSWMGRNFPFRQSHCKPLKWAISFVIDTGGWLNFFRGYWIKNFQGFLMKIKKFPGSNNMRKLCTTAKVSRDIDLEKLNFQSLFEFTVF